MNLTKIRNCAAVICAAILGFSACIPVTNTFALEAKYAMEDPESDNSTNKAKSAVKPEELTHDARFDGYTKLDCIDVSSHQGKIDWSSVAKAGVDCAIIRVGYRGYDEGKIVEDKYFRTNLKSAYDAGLQVGVYFYTQAVSVAEAQEEAQFVLDTVGAVQNVKLSLPIYVDMEKVDHDKGRLDSMKFTKAEHTELCNTFCDVIAQQGYQTGVYSNKCYMESNLLMEELEYHNVWMANYVFGTRYRGKYDVWQYSQSSRINGIKGTVDRSVVYTLSPADELPAPALTDVIPVTEPITVPIVAGA